MGWFDQSSLDTTIPPVYELLVVSVHSLILGCLGLLQTLGHIRWHMVLRGHHRDATLDFLSRLDKLSCHIDVGWILPVLIHRALHVRLSGSHTTDWIFHVIGLQMRLHVGVSLRCVSFERRELWFVLVVLRSVHLVHNHWSVLGLHVVRLLRVGVRRENVGCLRFLLVVVRCFHLGHLIGVQVVHLLLKVSF